MINTQTGSEWMLFSDESAAQNKHKRFIRGVNGKVGVYDPNYHLCFSAYFNHSHIPPSNSALQSLRLQPHTHRHSHANKTKLDLSSSFVTKCEKTTFWHFCIIFFIQYDNYILVLSLNNKPLSCFDQTACDSSNTLHHKTDTVFSSFIGLLYVDVLTQSNNLWHKTFNRDDHHYS